jgi:hypothetical protein
MVLAGSGLLGANQHSTCFDVQFVYDFCIVFSLYCHLCIAFSLSVDVICVSVQQ